MITSLLQRLPSVEPEALIEEARRRARRRRLRNLLRALVVACGVAAVVLLIVGRSAGGGSPSSASALSASNPKKALPAELSFNVAGGVVLVHRDGTRRVLVPGIERERPDGSWLLRFYSEVEWSPDGSKLLLFSYGAGVPWGLVVVGANGRFGPTITGRAIDAHWSPDGKEIAYTRHEAGLGRVLYLVSSDGGTPTRLATHLQTFGTFSWSHDGKRLAAPGQGQAGLFVVDRLGHRVTLVAHRSVGTVRWSPDGSLIAFTAGGLYVVHPDGTGLRRVGTPYDFDWSNDGRWLALDGPAGGTWGDVSVVRPDGSGLHRIAGCRCDLRGPGASQAVAWSPDDTRVAYLSGRGNTVSTVRPDGTGATVVATQPARGLSGTGYPSLPLWRATR